LNDLGFEGKLEVYDIPKNLHGFQGDTRPDKANVIIRREHVGSASNDIGFILREDGSYEAIISDYDSSRYNSNWLNKLQQRYSLHVVEETAQLENYFIEETTEDEIGNIYITMETND